MRGVVVGLRDYAQACPYQPASGPAGLSAPGEKRGKTDLQLPPAPSLHTMTCHAWQLRLG